MTCCLPRCDTGADLHWYFGHMRPRVDTAVEQLLRGMFPGAEANAIHAQSVLQGGKRLRGCLTCLIGAALGQASVATLQRAAAVECIQAASLVHDDFVDQDRTRRGERAAWTVLGPRRAVLLGDVVFASALHEMMILSRADGLVLARAISTVALGAYSEPLESADLAACGTVDYNQLVRLKTGTLFGAAAELGAIAAQAPAALCRAAFEFGALVGDAYQVADDLADLTLLSESYNVVDLYAQISPALAHYLPEERQRLSHRLAEGGIGSERALLKLWPCLQERMQSDLVWRTRVAGEKLSAFPNNHFTQMLHAAAGEMARVMYPRIRL